MIDLKKAATGLILVGGLNWGIIGLMNVNYIEKYFGSISILIKAIYIAIGISTLYFGFQLITNKQ